MRLLYVDDDRINTLLFTETCRCAGGLELETAASGSEALECVANWLPELLVIDLHLPDTTGFDLLPAIRRAQPALAGVPAFLCSADDAVVVGPAALAAGFHSCWPKPAELPFVLGELTRLGHTHQAP
jgi:two-component system, OmpR family, response regulator